MFSLVHSNHQLSPDVHGGVSRETYHLECAQRLSGWLIFALLRSGLGKTLLWPGLKQAALALGSSMFASIEETVR